MKKVQLAFPNNLAMAEFILQQKVSQVQTDSKYHTLSGLLSNEEIRKACKSYDAEIIKTVGTIHYD